MKILVMHGGYGCDTGCCGHYFVVDGDEYFKQPQIKNLKNFDFSHPGWQEDHRKFAEDLVREQFGEEHVKDLDWENCLVTDD